jgi:hypothetical protein
MKLFCALTTLAAASVLASVNPQLREVKRVYILAMTSSMDQFLASQLAKAGIFEVVTDPKKADAIITDRVGESFENKLDDLYPPPTPPKPAAKPGVDAPPDTAKTDTPKTDTPKILTRSDALAGVDLTGAPHPTTMGRSKGNIFIVSRGTRSVLWSIYEPPKNNTSRELTKTAERVVKHLQEDLTDKKPSE